MKTITPTLVTVSIFVSLLFPSLVNGQSSIFSYNKKYSEAGIASGSSHFVGDVGNTASVGYTSGIYFSRRLTPLVSVRAGLDYTRLQGDDSKVDPTKDFDRYVKNLHFRNDVFSLSVEGVLDFIPNYGFFAARQKVVPYAVAGISTFIHNPQARGVQEQNPFSPTANPIGDIKSTTDEWTDLRDLQTEGVRYSKVGIAIPTGLGVRIAVTPKINLSVETLYNFTFTDYIDDAAGKYIDFEPGDENASVRKLYSNRTAENIVERDLLNTLSDNGLSLVQSTYSDETAYFAVEGRTHEDGSNLRGNSNNNDSFFTVRAKLGFVFGGKSLRPKL